MSKLATQRCSNHIDRQAAARCPECTKFFCRECITEHDDRVICASCLKKQTEETSTSRLNLGGVMLVFQFIIAFVILWLFFYQTGQVLLEIPANFHEGTLWKDSFKF